MQILICIIIVLKYNFKLYLNIFLKNIKEATAIIVKYKIQNLYAGLIY